MLLGITISTLDNLAIVSLLIGLFIFLMSIYKQVKRYRQQHTDAGTHKRKSIVLSFILFCHVMAFIGFVGMVLQPSYLTDGFDDISLITFPEKSHDQNLDNSLYLLVGPNMERQKSPANIHEISDVGQLEIRHPNINKLLVLGDGLTSRQWQQIAPRQINYQTPALKLGVIKPEWKNQIQLGQNLIFNGQLQALDEMIYEVSLVNPADEVVDSINLKNRDVFQLTDAPKFVGQHVYRIELHDRQKNLVSSQKFGIKIVNNAALRLLIIQSAPTFEGKQLKRWAAAQGENVTTLTQISRNRFMVKSINPMDEDLANGALNGVQSIKSFFASRHLDNFDLVIMDGRSFTLFDQADRSLLAAAVKNGLGVQFNIDGEFVNLLNNTDFSLLNNFSIAESLENDRVSIGWLDTQGQWINSGGTQVNLRPYRLDTQSENKTLAVLPKNESAVVQKRFGIGKVNLSRIADTHQWVTQGENIRYADFWQSLVYHTARTKKQNHFQAKNKSALLFANQRAQVCALLSKPLLEDKSFLVSAKPLRALEKNTKTVQKQILMQQNPLVERQYCGYFWPNTIGWWQISGRNDIEIASQLLWINEISSWPAHQQWTKIEATKAMQSRVRNLSKEKESALTSMPINPIYFWCMLIIFLSTIWIEEKVRKLS